MKTYEELLDRFPWAVGQGREYHAGWVDLVFSFCEEVEERYRAANKELDFEIFAIREKYAELRFEYDKVGSIDLDDLERKYEKLSAKTCETCGEKGTFRDDSGWFSVACDSCYKPS